jgi:rRNA pseudouridine-1189 N-methylase Emg1 (Nep1/Mra1 family)
MLMDLNRLNESIAALTTEVSMLSQAIKINEEALRIMMENRGDRITRKELLERLRISDAGLRLWIKVGKFPPADIDNKWLLSEVIEWERDAKKRRAT